MEAALSAKLCAQLIGMTTFLIGRPPCDAKSQEGFYALAQGINMAVILFELLDKLEFTYLFL